MKKARKTLGSNDAAIVDENANVLNGVQFGCYLSGADLTKTIVKRSQSSSMS